LILSKNSTPIVEFMTTCHRGAWLMAIVDHFLTHASDINGGRRPRPKTVVVDFSFALIYCCLLAFNRCNISEYLNKAWHLVSAVTRSLPITYVQLCRAHLMNATARKLVRCEKKLPIRKAVLVMLASLSRATTLAEATQKYKAIHLLLTTPHYCNEMTAAKMTLITHCERDEEPDIDKLMQETKLDQDNNKETSFSIRHKSPFALHFAAVIATNSATATNDETGEENDLYSPSAFRVISDMMAYIPMWSQMLTKEIHLTPTNSVVESHFRNLKMSTAGKRRNMRPGAIIRKQLVFVRAKLNEATIINSSETGSKKSKRKTIDNEEDKWSRCKRPRRSYSDKQSAQRHLFNKAIKKKAANPVKR
jgi:hypothetical protein